MICLYEPLLWTWPWRQQTNLFPWHSNTWRYLDKSSSVTKGSAAQKTFSGQTFTNILNLRSNFDIGHSNFSQDIPSKDLEASTPIFLMALRLVIMHHCTMFDHKRFSGSEENGQTNIPWHFEPLVWQNTVIPFSHKSQNTPDYDDMPST